MIYSSDFFTSVWPVLYKTLIGLAFTGFLTVAMWPLKKIKAEWVVLKTQIGTLHEELSTQRTNCLQSLQDHAVVHTKLLEKSVDVLSNMHLDIVKQTGYLEAIASKPYTKSTTT